ncbi:sirohydrochlorin chelatase [Gordonia crocea]|uniref:Cobalamin biosynthesis protein CbiX n=1 Tax=Gordonia crocea TaxID=589162 RepID=A0A7I9UXI7_9ACTN|nr:sirohydrochlorin chelatase [Gordonia crocea]GED97530.1 cobalamin biosynthesis protein CbiX [Gordonia crocea]
MTTLLVAHGTRNPHGVAMIGDLAAAMSEHLRDDVRVGFVDVLGPDPAEALDSIGESGPVTVVPAFLASGYHVRADLPAYLRQAQRTTLLAPALGPDSALADAMVDRLLDAGWMPGEPVVLAAAGSRDPRAQADVAAMGRLLAKRVGAPVRIGFVMPAADGSGYPPVAEVVAGLRAQTRPGTRIAVATYLLADGLFARRMHEVGADVVGDPLGLHPSVVALACDRAASATAAVELARPLAR